METNKLGWVDVEEIKTFLNANQDDKDSIADDFGELIYFCPDCDEECREDYSKCERFPLEHDDSGYMGTGTSYSLNTRFLAALILQDN